jgi:HEAT repeat protein
MDVTQATADLKSNDAKVRAAAAEQLAQLEDAAQPSAVALVMANADEDEAVRQWATAALESLGPPAAGDIPQLAKLLSDPHLDVAYWAATLLGRLEADGAPSVPGLVGALQSHPEVAVRQRAAWALGQIGAAAKAAEPALVQAANASDPRLSRLAQEALEKMK